MRMQTGHHLSTRWAELGYGSSIVSFAIMTLVLVDVCNVTTFGTYNTNTTYLLKIGYMYEFAIAIIGLLAGISLAALTFYERRRK